MLDHGTTGCRPPTIHVQPMSQVLAKDVDSVVLQINQAMESLIRQCPAQYLWGYARFKQPRQEA